MQHARSWLVVAMSAIILLSIGAVLSGAPAAAVSAAQATPATPRPGIQTVLTVVGTATKTAPAATEAPTTSAAPASLPAATALAPALEPALTPAGTATTPVTTAVPLSSAPVTRSLGLTNTLIPALAGGFPGTIVVVGEGRVNIQPDIARLTLGVDSVKPTVKEASDDARQTMDAVVKAVKAQGVADKDIQTSSFNIYVERIQPSDSKTGSEEVRYHVNNSVNITARDLNKVSNILDAAIEAGANNVYGVTYAVENTDPVEAQARQVAVADAQRRAQDLARLNGVRVGPVIGISEVIGAAGGGQVSNTIREAAPLGMGGGGGSFNPGQLEQRMQLQITYAMQ